LKINPNDVFSIGNKGMALSNLGKDEEAIVWSDKAFKINSDYDKARNYKKLALEHLSKKNVQP
jgi:hypothetical protein